MKRFSFRFQRLLELKQRKEDQQKAELGEVMAIFNREFDELGGLKQSFDAYRHTSLALPDQRVETSLLGINASYLLRLHREMGEQRAHLDRIESMVEDKRGKLLEATRERRVYEILKERAEEKHKRETMRQERIQLDEIGGQLYVRRGSTDTELNG
ncbi:MAG: flagellar export protein FliJ [Candidatus Latescibacteria bacterium]|jgi:flagellar FliJ protein|nr:flagellar export protein FliJ [Candidatus Latescibacterota bacterium]|tara:strand:+ start:1105 stop:1572 length:468 start_codon:yes stop_codon:yes gene_type:complete